MVSDEREASPASAFVKGLVRSGSYTGIRALQGSARPGGPERHRRYVREIDADGVHGGGVKQALRALQGFTTEGDHLRHYEEELVRGHLVVDVTVHGRQKRDTVVQILRSCGAHFINAYGPWTIESVAA